MQSSFDVQTFWERERENPKTDEWYGMDYIQEHESDELFYVTKIESQQTCDDWEEEKESQRGKKHSNIVSHQDIGEDNEDDQRSNRPVCIDVLDNLSSLVRLSN